VNKEEALRAANKKRQEDEAKEANKNMNPEDRLARIRDLLEQSRRHTEKINELREQLARDPSNQVIQRMIKYHEIRLKLILDELKRLTD